MKTGRIVTVDELPTALRMMRKAHGLTLKEAAKLADISYTFLSDVERGRTNPSFHTLAALTGLYREPLVLWIGEVEP